MHEKKNSISEDDYAKYFSGFKRVYSEEIGQEVFMDDDGNLYDLEGNALEQADPNNI